MVGEVGEDHRAVEPRHAAGPVDGEQIARLAGFHLREVAVAAGAVV